MSVVVVVVVVEAVVVCGDVNAVVGAGGVGTAIVDVVCVCNVFVFVVEVVVVVPLDEFGCVAIRTFEAPFTIEERAPTPRSIYIGSAPFVHHVPAP